MAEITSKQLQDAIDAFQSASSEGNLAKFQEAVREFNLKYANDVAGLYGQNYGPGQPAPIGAATLASGEATGSIGYIPGFSGLNAGQTQSELAQQASTAQGAAGLTGFYAAPSQSRFTPGTFVRLDPNTYDTGTYGPVQLSYVLPSGQLQRVNIPQAQAMGWNGNLSTINTVSAAEAQALEQAPPTQLPTQTLQGVSAYANLNAQAQNAALQQAGVTGMYTAPATVYAPGTDLMGHTFQQLDPEAQRAYYVSNGGDWNAAMQKWVNDSNKQITAWYQQQGLPVPGQPGAPQETLQAQNQYFTQAADLANQFGQYYTPGMPGQANVAGVNAPTQGQLTLANIAQQNQIKQAWAQQYGYVPQFDANGQPIFQEPTGGGPATTLAAQQQAYAQQMGVITAAAALQANPFRQAQVMGQAGRLLAGMPSASFSAPNTVAGVGTAGGNTQGGLGYLQQMVDDIRNPTPNQTTADAFLAQTPTPNKIDSTSFLRAAPSTQNILLQAMQEKYGIDPKDAMTQIQNTLPQFQAPTFAGTVKR